MGRRAAKRAGAITLSAGPPRADLAVTPVLPRPLPTPGCVPHALHQLWRARSWLLLGAAAVLFVCALDPALYLWGDNAHYVIVAKAIATGRGWTDIHFPDSPPFRYPIPLFPLLLAPIVALFDYALVPLKLLIIATGLVAVFALHRLYQRLLDAPTAFVLAALVVVSPQVVSFTHQVMTEIPYVALSAMAVLAALRYGAEARWATRTGVLLGVLLAASVLVRTLGAALVAGVVAYLALDGAARPRVRLQQAVAVGGLCLALWLLANAPILDEIIYVGELQEGTLVLQGAEQPTFGERVLTNVASYARLVPEAVLYGVYEHPGELPWRLLGAGVLLLLALGFAHALRRRRTPLEYYTLAYFAILLVYEPSNMGNYQRYLVPMIPVFLYHTALGVRLIVDGVLRLAERPAATATYALRARAAVPTITAAALLPLLALGLQDTLQASVWHEEREMFDYYGLPGQEGYHRMARWAATALPPGSVVATRNAYIFHFWARHRTTWLPPFDPTRADAPRALCALPVDYVTVDALRPSRQDSLFAAALAGQPACFEPVYEDGANRIYRVLDVPTPAPTSSTATAA